MLNRILAVLLTIASGLTACAPGTPSPAGVVSVNARVIDGSGGPSRHVNVKIVGERIAAVGNFEPTGHDTVVDAGDLFPDRDLDRRDGAEYILRDMLSPEGILVPSFRPEPDYDGLTIAEIVEIRGSDEETTLMALLKADRDMGGEQSGSQMLGFALEEPDIESLMAWRRPLSPVTANSMGQIRGAAAPLRSISGITFASETC